MGIILIIFLPYFPHSFSLVNLRMDEHFEMIFYFFYFVLFLFLVVINSIYRSPIYVFFSEEKIPKRRKCGNLKIGLQKEKSENLFEGFAVFWRKNVRDENEKFAKKEKEKVVNFFFEKEKSE